jgi:hypothetical protein
VSDKHHLSILAAALMTMLETDEPGLKHEMPRVSLHLLCNQDIDLSGRVETVGLLAGLFVVTSTTIRLTEKGIERAKAVTAALKKKEGR